METPDNIKCFYQAIADILGRLYAQFPERVALLDATEWQENSRIPPSCKVTFEAFGRTLYEETLIWLYDEGFIRLDECSGKNFVNVRITSRGISLLTQKPRHKLGTFGSIFLKEMTKAATTTLGSKAAEAIWEEALDCVPELIRMMEK